MKRHGINARNATEKLSTPGKNVFVAVAKQSRSSRSVRYLLGILMGLLLAFLLIAPPTIVPNAEPQFAVIMKYRQMIERDDRAIRLLLEVEMWDRGKPIFGRSYLLSNGGEVLAFTQNPRADREYELSF
jgi:hypothetical protein